MQPKPALILLTVVCLLSFGAEILARYDADRGDAPGLGAADHATWLIGDCRAHRSVVRGLIYQGSIDPSRVMYDRDTYVPRADGRYAKDVSLNDSNASVTRAGGLVPKHSILFSAVLALPYALLHEHGMLLFNAVQCTLLVLAVFALCRTRFATTPSFIAAVTFLADGVLINYSYNVSPDVFGALLTVGGMVMLLGSRVTWGGGALIGLSIWMRPNNAIALVAAMPRAFQRPRSLLAPAIAFGLIGGAFLLLNWYWFGNPLITTYNRTLAIEGGVASIQDHLDASIDPCFRAFSPPLWTDTLA